jgi:hypothetical protein
MAHPVVEVVATSRSARVDPELVVLAVPVDGKVTGEQAARVRAQRRFADREDVVRGDANEMRPRAEVVDDPLDGHDGAPARGKRAPHAFQEGRVERDVPLPVRDRRVQQRDVRVQRGEQPELAERRRDARVRVVRLHGRAGDRARDDGGEVARRRLEPLREGEERPVLHRDLAALVRAGEDRVRREVRERVARVPGHHVLDEPTFEEERPQARQAQHHQREPWISPPALARHLAGGGGPAGVADEDVQRVTGPNVLGDGVVQRGDLVATRLRHALSSTRSASRRRCQPW